MLRFVWYMLFCLSPLCLRAQALPCPEYDDFKKQAETWRLSNPREALHKYESMMECDPKRAIEEGVDKQIIDIFKDMLDAQRRAEENARRAVAAQKKAAESVKKLDEALYKAYYATIKKLYSEKQYREALAFSRKVKKRFPDKNMGELDPKRIANQIPDQVLCGNPIGNSIGLENLYFCPENKRLTCALTQTVWDNLLRKPEIIEDFETRSQNIWEEYEPAIVTGRYVVIYRALPKQPGFNEVILLKTWLETGKPATEMVRVKLEVVKQESWYSDNVVSRFLSNSGNVFFINEKNDTYGPACVFVEETGAVKCFTNVKCNPEVSYYSDKIDRFYVETAQNDSLVRENYLLPDLTRIKDKAPEAIPVRSGRVLNDSYTGFIVYEDSLPSGKKNARGVFLQRSDRNKTTLLTELDSSKTFYHHVLHDEPRQLAIVFISYGGALNAAFVYDLAADSVIVQLRDRPGIISLTAGYYFNKPEPWFLPWHSLNFYSINTPGEGEWVFFDKWEGGDYWEPLDHINRLLHGHSAPMFPEKGTLQFEDNFWQKKLTLLRHPLQANNSGRLEMYDPNSGAQVYARENATEAISANYYGYYGQEILLVTSVDPENAAASSVDIVIRSGSTAKITIPGAKASALSLQENGYVFVRDSALDGALGLRVYRMVNARTLENNDAGLPDTLLYVGAIDLSAAAMCSILSNAKVLSVQSNCDASGENCSYSLYSLPGLKLLKQVDYCRAIIDQGTSPAALLSIRYAGKNELFDVRTGMSFSRPGWDSIRYAVFLDTTGARLAVHYRDTLVDILTYPGAKLLKTIAQEGWFIESARGRFVLSRSPGADAKGKKTLTLYEMRREKVKKLETWKIDPDTYSGMTTVFSNFYGLDTVVTFDPETYEERVQIIRNSLSNGFLFTDNFCFNSRQQQQDTVWNQNITAYSTRPWRALRTWNNVVDLDSLDLYAVRVSYEGGSKTDTFRMGNKLLFAPSNPQAQAALQVQWLPVYRDAQYALDKSNDTLPLDESQSTYGRVYRMTHKASRQTKNWLLTTDPVFRPSVGRLFVLRDYAVGRLNNRYSSYHNTNQDTLLVYDCKTGINEVLRIPGNFIAHYNDAGSYPNWLSGQYGIRFDAPAGLCLAEANSTGATLHCLDTVSARSDYHHTFEIERGSSAVLSGKYLFLQNYNEYKGQSANLTLHDIRTGKKTGKSWKARDYQPVEIVRSQLAAIFLADKESTMVLFSLDSLKEHKRYPRFSGMSKWPGASAAPAEDYPVGDGTSVVSPDDLLGGYHWVNYNNQYPVYDLDLYEDAGLTRLAKRFKGIQSHFVSGKLLLTGKQRADDLYSDIPAMNWEAYRIERGLEKTGAWDQARLNREGSNLIAVSQRAREVRVKYRDGYSDSLNFNINTLYLFDPQRPERVMQLRDVKDNYIKLTDLTQNEEMKAACSGLVLVRAGMKDDQSCKILLIDTDSLHILKEWEATGVQDETVRIIDSLLIIRCRQNGALMDVESWNLFTHKSRALFKGVRSHGEINDSFWGIVRPGNPGEYVLELVRKEDLQVAVTVRRPYPMRVEFLYSKSGRLSVYNGPASEIKEAFFLDDRNRLLELPKDAYDFNLRADSWEREYFITCKNRSYVVSVESEDQINDLNAGFWKIQVYDYADETSRTELKPKPVNDTPYEAPRFRDQYGINMKYDAGNCNLRVQINDETRVFSLLKKQ